MTTELSVTLIYAHIILNFVAAYFSYTIFRYNRLSKAWLAVVIALVVIGFNGIGELYIQLDLFPSLSSEIQFITLAFLPFTFSVLLVWGMLSMKKNFDHFEILEKKYSEKAKSFSKKSRKRKRKS